MPHPILPRLLPDSKRNKVQQFKSVGQWERRLAGEVKAVADALDVPDRDVEVHSVPDIWARALFFESELLGAPGSKVETEWRGLLAILALRERRSIQGLDFQPVFTSGAGKTKFLEVAERLLPDHLIDFTQGTDWQRVSIDQQTRWRHVSVIVLNKEAIGLTSPATLVCTAPGRKRDSVFERVEWYDRATGRLGDPQASLHPDEKRALAYWLAHLQTYLNGIHCEGPKYNRLSKALTSYRESLVGDLNAAQLREFSDAHGTPVEGAALAYLGTPVANKEDSGSWDLELKSYRTKSPSHKAIVLDADVPRQWRKPATEITVISSVPLQAALNTLDPAHRDIIHGTPIPAGLWYRAEDFFTPKLHVFTQAGGIPGAMPVERQLQVRYKDKQTSVILPIRQKWLEWLTAEELSKRLTFSSQGDDVDVFFTLPLCGGDLTVYHRYSQHDIQDCGSQLPVSKLWPFLNAPGWRVYFAYYDNGGEENVYLEPFVPGERAKPKPIPVIPPSREHRAEVSKVTMYPEAMLATFKGKEAGLILLQPPVRSLPSGQQWKVGIDFGTTGTAIFSASSMTGEGHPLQFKPRLQSVTNEKDFEPLTYRRFMPSLTEDGGSLLSIFHDFSSQEPEQPNMIQPLLEGRVCFIQDVEAFKASDRGISTNMKWGNDLDRARGRAFLEQLTLQVAAEAAAEGAQSISWRFSFPTAFSEKELSAFETIWQDIVERCAQQTGITPAAGQQGILYKRKNESVATAHAFQKTDKAGPHAGAIFVDIGGGTTDIAIWQGNKKALSQASFRFAGRDIFMHPLFLRPTFLKLFGRNVSKLQEVHDSDEYIFHSQVDVMLKGESSSKLLSQLPTVANDQNPIVLQFLDLLQLGIAGILHYIGLTLKELEAEGRYKRFMPNIYIGGNGSKILLWLGLGSYKINSPADRLLKTVFARATGFSDLGRSPFEIRISRMPKCEVAQGLLLDYDSKVEANDDWVDLFQDEPTDPPLLAGEDYLLNGVPKSWDSFLSTQTDLSHIQIASELPQMSTLLQVLKIAPDPYQLRQCSTEVNQAMSETAADEQDRHVEPLFITALRSLHRQRAEHWAELPLAPQEK